VSVAELDRRRFLVAVAAVAGGVGLSVAPRKASAEVVTGSTAAELDPWILIRPDDVVVVRTPTPEIGNGAMTQIAMNVTEELACDWSKVRVEFASIQRDQLEKNVYTSGWLPFFSGHGTSEERMAHALQLGASARERLKAAAAARWKVPAAEVQAANSVLTHAPTGRTLRYGDVAGEAAAVKLPAEPKPKPQSEWTFLGKASPPKINAREIANGTAVYGIDAHPPGMVYAALRQSPIQGGKLKSCDASAVLKMPGVRAVVTLDPSKTKGSPVAAKPTFWLGGTEVQSGVAVIADHYWQAKTALEALPVEWDAGPGAGKTADVYYQAARAALDAAPAKTEVSVGDPASVKPARTVEAEYSTPFAENATMEPLNSTVLYTPERMEIWHPGQDQQQAFWVAIDESGLPPEKVIYHQTMVGGGFGRRTLADDLRMGVAVAKEYPGVPVKTIWSREESMRQGRYRHPVATRMKAGLAADGSLSAFTSHTAIVGQEPIFLKGLGDMPYFTEGGIPNVRIGVSRVESHVLTGAYRAPNYNSHVLALESFVDECAHAAGIDPLEYRLRLLKHWDAAWSACLKVAAEKAGWGQPLPKGEGRGIAIANWPTAGMHQAGTTMCAVAHVAVSREGALTVKRIDVSFDCGRVANEDAVRAQIEGGSLFGLSTLLHEETTLRDGSVVEGNFNRYKVLRTAEAPEVNVHFDALSGHERFSIVGEAPVGPIQGAVANAVFQATGKRIRQTPFSKQDLSWT
jgi:isoquinoline 1-oxidoreductase beta subunit